MTYTSRLSFLTGVARASVAAATLASATLLAPLAPSSSSLHAQAPTKSAAFKVPEIAYEKYTLANGLTVLLSRDTTAPVVAVDVWYHVGSKNEVPGRTGFAHLFEHMLFQGSQHVPYGQHFKIVENAGGTLNGTTSNDRTNYFEAMPSNQLETALWLESDRMGFLLPALDQTKLDAQRDVVKNERRQRVDNVPFGSADEVMSAALLPSTNPYSWPVIGSMADLSAATLDDVKNFFRTYYAPGNATLAIVGDIDVAKTKALVEKYFGPIPAGPAITRPTIAPVTLPSEKRLVLEDARSQLPQLQIVWPTVGSDHADNGALSVLGNVLTQDRTSRLTKLLVYDRQLATRVGAGQREYENHGRFIISVTPRPNASLTEIERLIDSTLTAITTTAPPTQAEVDRIKNYIRVYSVLGLDGAMNKAERLLEGQVFHKDPLFYVKETNEALGLNASDVARVAKQYLNSGRVVLSMIPAGKLDMAAKPDVAYTNVTPKPEAEAAAAPKPAAPAAAPATVADATATAGTAGAFDRNKAPTVGPARSLSFPKAQTRKLKNGTEVVVLEDHSTPSVSVSAVIDISSTLDPAGKTGLQGVMMSMLREGTTKHSADQLADAFASLGNSVSPTGFYTIKANVDRSLDLMAEQLLSPAFPEASLKRITANGAASIKRAQESPGYIAGRVFSNVVYGKSHPYSRADSEQDMLSITRDDVTSFYETYLRPPNVKFVVAGDITPDQAVEKLNRVFGAWAPGKSGKVTIPAPAGVDSTVIYLYDRPSSPQSIVYVGNVGPRRDTPDYFAIQLMNTTLGGAFTSRVNLNLREQHQYTYGASSFFSFRRPPEVGTYGAQSAVVAAKTDSALIEVMKELRDIRGPRPITADEFSFAQKSATAGLPLEFETISQRAGAVSGLVAQGLPLDYYNTVIAKYNGVTIKQAQAAAEKYINPSKLAIVIVGDRKAIEEKLRAAGVAPVVVVDSF